MRLICPNCGAQYEVPDDVIPPEGRDVQCSNCGVTWFQDPNRPDPELNDDYPSDEENDWNSEDTTADESLFDGASEEDELSSDAEESYSDDFATPDEDDAEEEVSPAPTPEPQRRELDPSVAELLREEAEHEARARAAETAGGLESQPDLGLTEPGSEAAQRERDARNRMARLRGEPEQAAALAASASRRDLLPDIEEINSTLRSTSDRRDDEETESTPEPVARSRKRGGFRTGFMLVLMLALVLLLIYVFAPQIGTQVPALAELLDTYVSKVDAGRVWLDRELANMMIWLDEKAAASASHGEN
jgi:predicted Zn finger-like uncharacterized protein